MSSKILLVFEGEKTEINLSRFLEHYIKCEKIITSTKCNLYGLYSLLKSDDGFLDIVSLLKERDKELNEFGRDEISSIYLFFDHDGHATQYNENALEEMMTYFNNEFEYGKLFISYPMVEALKNIPDIDDCSAFLNHKYIKDKNREYKKIVNDSLLPKIQRSLTIKNMDEESADILNKITLFHCIKANYIAFSLGEYPNTLVSQVDVYNKQHIQLKADGAVYVVCAFPLMLLDYFGAEKLKTLITKESKSTTQETLTNAGQ